MEQPETSATAMPLNCTSSVEMTDSIRAAIRSLGADFDPRILAATVDIYRPHHSPERVKQEPDLAYGEAARQRLDLYLPLEGTPRGVVVYVHGGGFVGGGRRVDEHLYANVGHYFAARGWAAVIPSYRLAPADPWPAAAHDVRDAVRWVRSHPALGAAGDRPFVIGQSAGASHVASWLLDAQTRAEPLGSVGGVVLMSGFYVADATMSANAMAYFGDDPAQWQARSPLCHACALDVPLCLTVAELEPGTISSHTYRLASALSLAQDRTCELRWLAGHNHASTVISIGTAQSEVADMLMLFMETHRAKENPQ